MATRQRICRIRVLAQNSPFLANSSTRQNGLFEKLVALAKFAYIRQPSLLGLARLVDIRQPVLLGLARLVDIRQPVLLRLARLAGFGEFSECIESVESSKFCIFLRTLHHLSSRSNKAKVVQIKKL
jgi:hypothetical protein